MGKALVLKGCNFSANKVTTVTLESSKPCTGITLDKSTVTLDAVGATVTLTATPRPADTTDPVVWTSSNENVATVNNGVVTSVGLGTATITATCGNYSATCSVTANTTVLTGVNLKPALVMGDGTYSSGNGLGYIQKPATATEYGAIVAGTGTLSLYGNYDGGTYYPIVLPENANRVEITVGANIRGNSVLLLSSTTPASGQSGVAQMVDKIAYASLAPVNNVIAFNIPSYDNFPRINAIAIGLQKTNSSAFTDSDFATITVKAVSV